MLEAILVLILDGVGADRLSTLFPVYGDFLSSHVVWLKVVKGCS
jgi:hypothetical protein